MSEKSLLNQILLRISKNKCRLFRNNTGKGWTGSRKQFTEIQGERAVIIFNPRPLTAGLIKGSPDLVGWSTIEITPEMVGKEIAVFTGIEVKSGSTPTSNAQKIFLENLANAGGIGGIAKDVEQATQIIKDFQKIE